MSVTLGPYEIERSVGTGGMAEVVLAHYRGPGGFAKRVALKRILPEYCADKDFAALFRDEARLAAHLVHPNIVSLHDFGELDGRLFMAMEFIDGVDLKSILQHFKKSKGNLFDEELVCMLAIDLASALGFAHDLQVEGKAANVVHRDVSPANVLVSADGGVKLADFGIARAVTSDRHRTRTGIVKGKVPYMAPEQALGQRVDKRADLFSLGVVLYECLALERPYQGSNDLDTLQRAIKGTHRQIAELVPTIHPAFADVIERLIHPRADERFQSANDLLDALAEVTPKTSARRAIARLVRTIRGDTPTPAPDDESTRAARARSIPDPDADRTRIEASPSWLAELSQEPPLSPSRTVPLSPSATPLPASPAAPPILLAPMVHVQQPVFSQPQLAQPVLASVMQPRPAAVAQPLLAPIAQATPPTLAPSPLSPPVLAPLPTPSIPVLGPTPGSPSPASTPMLAPPASLAPLSFAPPAAAPSPRSPRPRRMVEVPRAATPLAAPAAHDDSDAVARWTFRGLAVLALFVMLLSLGIVVRAALDTAGDDVDSRRDHAAEEGFDEEENTP